jgi:hypothetical protein
MENMNQNTINKFCVYFHYRASDNQLFYIGYGDLRRPYDFRNRSIVWKRVKNKHGVKVEIVAKNLSKNSATDLEIKYIKEYRPMCNFAPGGCGGDVWSNMSAEQKEQIREKQRKAQSGKLHSQYGKSKTEETKEKIRKAKESVSKPIRCIQTGQIFRSINEVSRSMNIGNSYIKNIIKGKNKTIYGYSFELINPNI